MKKLALFAFTLLSTVDYNLLSEEVSSGFCIIEDKNDHVWARLSIKIIF